MKYADEKAGEKKQSVCSCMDLEKMESRVKNNMDSTQLDLRPKVSRLCISCARIYPMENVGIGKLIRFSTSTITSKTAKKFRGAEGIEG